MIGRGEVEKAVEDAIILELKKVMVKHINEVLEDTIVEIMQNLVIRMYRSEKLKGLQFEIEIKGKQCS